MTQDPTATASRNLNSTIPSPVADNFAPLPHLTQILRKCSEPLSESGPVIYLIQSGHGPGLPLPGLPQVSDASAWRFLLVVDPMTVERVKYNWEDPLNIESQLTEEEIAIRYEFSWLRSGCPLNLSNTPVTLLARTARSAGIPPQTRGLFC